MTETENFAHAAAPAAEMPASARTLLRVVYIMGVVLVLLFLLLIGGIIWKATQGRPPPAPPAPAALRLGLPPGSTIQSMVLDGDRLALNTGTEVVVIDVRKNAVLSRISTAQP